MLVLALMSALAFMAVRFMPGDPIASMYGNKDVSDEVILKVRAQYNLDKPVLEQYYIYMRDLLHGDMGLSYFYIGKPVTAVIGSGFKNTLSLVILAFPLVVLASIFLGCLSAYRKGRPTDKIINGVTVFITAMPDVPLATFLVLLLAVKLKIFPIAGWGSFKYMLLPAFFIALWPTLSLAKMIRSLIIEESKKPYVYMARTRGLSNRAVITGEILPNIMLPVTTSLGMIFGHMLEGALIAELVFNIPGLGRLATDAIFRRDYPVIMGIILLATLIYTAINYTVDILHLFLDPRIRQSDTDY